MVCGLFIEGCRGLQLPDSSCLVTCSTSLLTKRRTAGIMPNALNMDLVMCV